MCASNATSWSAGDAGTIVFSCQDGQDDTTCLAPLPLWETLGGNAHYAAVMSLGTQDDHNAHTRGSSDYYLYLRVSIVTSWEATILDMEKVIVYSFVYIPT